MKAKLFAIFLVIFVSLLQFLVKKSVLGITKEGLVSSESQNYQNKSDKFYKIAQDNNSELEALEQRIRTNPNDAEAFQKRGVIYAYNEDYQKAIEDYNQSLNIDPNNAQIYNYRGTAYYWLKNYQQALDDYNQALSLNPDFALAYYNRGYVHQNLGDIQRAIEDFKQGANLSLKQGDINSYEQAVEMIKELEKGKLSI